MIEYNKATFLLESSKSKNNAEHDTLSKTISGLEKELKKKNSAIITLVILFALVLIFSIVFFLYTRLAT